MFKFKWMKLIGDMDYPVKKKQVCHVMWLFWLLTLMVTASTDVYSFLNDILHFQFNYNTFTHLHFNYDILLSAVSLLMWLAYWLGSQIPLILSDSSEFLHSSWDPSWRSNTIQFNENKCWSLSKILCFCLDSLIFLIEALLLFTLIPRHL